jgi:hypothetical protein
LKYWPSGQRHLLPRQLMLEEVDHGPDRLALQARRVGRALGHAVEFIQSPDD